MTSVIRQLQLNDHRRNEISTRDSSPPKTDPSGSQPRNSDLDGACVGIDLGGTTIKLGLVRAGEILAREEIYTSQFSGPQQAFAHAVEFARKSARFAGLGYNSVQAAGLAVPGVLSEDRNTMRETANLSAWENISLTEKMQNAFARPCAILNDADAAALAEYALRARVNSRADSQQTDQTLALLTLGTGVGCGLVVRGTLYQGDHGFGAELGHIVVNAGANARVCGCGRRGHLEAYAGSTGVVQTADELLRTSGDSLLHAVSSDSETTVSKTSESGTAMTPKHIAAAAAAGDAVALAVIDQTAAHVGQAVGILQQMLDSAVVLLGGAMTFGGAGSETGERFIAKVSAVAKEQTLVEVGNKLSVEFASLGNDAGILGAASLASQRGGNSQPTTG